MKKSLTTAKSTIPHRAGSTFSKKKKKQGCNAGNDSGESKNLKFVSSSCSKTLEPAFSKLDPNNPDHARRIQTRRRMISYGKNTVGYDEYLKKFPKEKRCPRSMDTPSTPDYTLDIPNKRWVGQVRAWRRALHNYDPPELKTFLAEDMLDDGNERTPTLDRKRGLFQNTGSVKDQELAKAKSSGLQVLFDDGNSKQSPTSVVQSNEMTELDKWEEKRNDDNDDEFFSDGDPSVDSDDDLL
eukprot:scaffold25411_cov152-Cylindrotheca_fusiformis.AAC.7